MIVEGQEFRSPAVGDSYWVLLGPENPAAPGLPRHPGLCLQS